MRFRLPWGENALWGCEGARVKWRASGVGSSTAKRPARGLAGRADGRGRLGLGLSQAAGFGPGAGWRGRVAQRWSLAWGVWPGTAGNTALTTGPRLRCWFGHAAGTAGRSGCRCKLGLRSCLGRLGVAVALILQGGGCGPRLCPRRGWRLACYGPRNALPVREAFWMPASIENALERSVFPEPICGFHAALVVIAAHWHYD